MALDTNIALGVRPVETPNMLAQMGQMMQMRQAQQEFDSQNALRDAFAQGTDISDPAAFKRIAAINPKLAFDLRGKQLEQQQKGVETGLKVNEALGAALGGLAQNPSLDYARSTFSHLVSTGVLPPDKAAAMLAKLEADPGRIKEYATLGVNAAITAQAKMTDATSRRNTDVSSGASYQQAETARQRLKMEQSGTWTKGIIGDRVVLVNNRTGEIKDAMMPEPEPSGTVTVGPITTIPEPTGGGAAPINALAPQPAAGAAPVTNALVQPPATATPARQPLTTFNSQKVAKETVNAAGDVTQFNERGETIRVVPKAGKPSAAVEKEQAAIQKVPEAIAMNNDAIRKIDEMIGGVDARGNPLEGAKGQPHPGLSKATGLGGGVMRFFSGTEGKNFEIRHKEVLSQAFLDAFEALKGGGAITEKEGDKATAARTRMDLAQSKEEYITAAREYQGVLKRGVENARARMQRSGTAPPAGAPEDPLGIR
jgi:hypothetical protein